MNGYISSKNHIAMNDECTLVGPHKEETTVFCGRLSVSSQDFYGAGEKSLKPDVILVIYAEEYGGEDVFIFGDKKFAVLRTYERTDGLLEITGTRKVGLQ